MQFLVVREENIPRIANFLAVNEMDQSDLEMTLGWRMDERARRGEHYVIELDTFAKQWVAERLGRPIIFEKVEQQVTEEFD